jgi:hypothetical protein
MQNTNSLTINLQEVNTRNNAARHILAGFSTAMPALAEFWVHLEEALNDALALSAETMGLRAELQSLRLDHANLIAAARAAIAAHGDGEPDPLWYLHDELDARSRASQAPPTATRRRG